MSGDKVSLQVLWWFHHVVFLRICVPSYEVMSFSVFLLMSGDLLHSLFSRVNLVIVDAVSAYERFGPVPPFPFKTFWRWLFVHFTFIIWIFGPARFVCVDVSLGVGIGYVFIVGVTPFPQYNFAIRGLMLVLNDSILGLCDVSLFAHTGVCALERCRTCLVD